jgi:hypothetical protein
MQVSTEAAASQRERALQRRRTKECKTIRAELAVRQLRWKLAMLGALGSPTFAIVLLSYVQSRPNTAGVTPTGPFDGERRRPSS